LGDLGQAIQRSFVVRELDARLPPSPSVIARIQRFLDPLGFPRVFAGLEPDPGPPVDLPGTSALQPAINEVSRSTVRVEALGCGGFLTGSGFVAARNLVVTNAHVIAGTSGITVRDGNEARRAVPVVFDPETDLAVLRVSGLSGPPLTLATGELGRGTGGAVLGYPGGGPLTAGPAAVLQAFDAQGRDIYDDGLTTRAIYTIEATVRPGNSGGPFILPDGRVAGVVFARSVSDGSVGYALQASEVVHELQAANAQSSEVGTGRCAAD
jgi:S1-C subfamily serine protease